MISIKPLKSEDCERIIEWNEAGDEAFLFQWAGTTTYEFPLTSDQIIGRFDEENTSIFKILKDDVMIGTVELRSLENHSVRLCRFLIDPKCSGMGYGQAALKTIKEYVFNDLGMKRLDLNVYVFNVAAIRCYEKAGFLVERYSIADDPKRHSYTMSIVNQ